MCIRRAPSSSRVPAAPATLHITTIKYISKQAKKEGWRKYQQRGCIANNSANVNAGIKHDHVANNFIGMDETHRIAILSGILYSMAQKVKDDCGLVEDAVEDDGITKPSIYPDIKCLEIVASINIEKIMSKMITTWENILYLHNLAF